MTDVVEILHFHLFAGLGGAARGMNRGEARLGATQARFRCIGGVDVVPAAVRDFERLSGARGTLLDLFDREQYVAFHGHEPPSDWREATPEDLRRAAGGERPNIVFTSPPCKGFSGLLSEERSSGRRYQALNRLTLRGIMLLLEAWRDDPPDFILLENVPRVATRGRPLLDQIGALLRHDDYSVAETTHDCGELGELAQHRQRFLMVARHRQKVPPFLYEPPRRRVRGVGEVLGALPLPEAAIAGPMHRLPRLQWRTWVRLALVEAGSDWRSLERLAVENGYLRDLAILPEGTAYHHGCMGVQGWQTPAGTVTSRSGPTNGQFAVADPRSEAFAGGSGVVGWDEAARAITGEAYPSTGPFSVADPRVPGGWRGRGKGRVSGWDEGAGSVIAANGTGQGAFAVADPRLPDGERAWAEGRRGLGVIAFDQAAGTVTSQARPGQGAFAVADPRPGYTHEFGQDGVLDWHDPVGAIKGDVSPGTGRYAVADPRLPASGAERRHWHLWRVVRWADAAGAVIGTDRVGSGAASVADPRLACDADDRERRRFNDVYRVVRADEPAGAVTSGTGPSCGGQAIADPRLRLGGNWENPDHYGVVPFGAPTGAVTSSAGHDSGAFSVADPRLPAAGEQCVAVIRALDDTWHRPFTTLELAALQGLVDPEEHLELDGTSHSAWRERIGNAVPAPAAAAIASVMGKAILLARAGERFALGSTSVWVRPLVVAISVETPS